VACGCEADGWRAIETLICLDEAPMLGALIKYCSVLARRRCGLFGVRLICVDETVM